MPTIRAIKAEATAVCKGIEMNHGNSFHYLTFELDSGERIYFQVSMKSYMLIVEGDRCLIKYKSLTNSPLKKLKSFERIVNTSVAPIEPQQMEERIAAPVMMQEVEEPNMEVDDFESEFNEIEQVEVIEEQEAPAEVEEALPQEKEEPKKKEPEKKQNQPQKNQQNQQKKKQPNRKPQNKNRKK